MDLTKVQDNIAFSITVYGKVESFSETLSKARCRIFYKYGNRNGTYITDEFADILIKTLPYAPVKGIFGNEEEDYTDHGVRRDEGRIYGIVPAEPNFAWEEHEDEDGKIRTYACCDVLLYTAIYNEAKDIVGKSQSMELYKPATKGQWQIIDGREYFVLTEGCFLGLQILGDKVTPCFEGAGFYNARLFSLYESTDITEILEKYRTKYNNDKGGEKMDFNFKLSDNTKYNMIFSLLNPNCTEENNWAIEYGICDIYDDYAVVVNYQEGIFERIYYTKNDATDSLQLGDRVRCYIVDVTEKEKVALDTLQKLNGGNYELSDEKLARFELDSEAEPVAEPVVEPIEEPIEEPAEEPVIELVDESIEEPTVEPVEELIEEPVPAPESEKDSEFSLKIEELKEQVNTLITEKAEAVEQIRVLNETIATLTQFKLETEQTQKLEVLSSYSNQLPSEIIEQYRENAEKYSPVELDKELAYELRKTGTMTKTAQVYIPKVDDSADGINQILNKYKK